MTIEDIDRYFRSVMIIDQLSGVDLSLNGMQAERENRNIARIAFAVDACLETFRRSAEWGADMLFVHHGLYWGRPLAAVGTQFSRLKYLFDNDLALYAVHLPLDMHPEFGNNACIASALDLEGIEQFGEYKGQKIGFKGNFPVEKSIDDVLGLLGLARDDCPAVLPFGKSGIKSAAVISGGAPNEVAEALADGVDLYITGEIAHSVYHACLEGKINMIAGGHYNTEVWGVKNLAARTAEDTGLETVFIDVPTGL